MDEELNIVGERLKELRKERQLTMEMVVTDMNQKFAIDITRGNLSRWENNVNLPTLRMAAYLCKYYGISLDYLMGFTDSRVPADLLAQIKKKKDKA